jgi:hypothetical protein
MGTHGHEGDVDRAQFSADHPIRLHLGRNALVGGAGQGDSSHIRSGFPPEIAQDVWCLRRSALRNLASRTNVCRCCCGHSLGNLGHRTREWPLV